MYYKCLLFKVLATFEVKKWFIFQKPFTNILGCVVQINNN